MNSFNPYNCFSKSDSVSILILWMDALLGHEEGNKFEDFIITWTVMNRTRQKGSAN